jgi:hypothetical protein
MTIDTLVNRHLSSTGILVRDSPFCEVKWQGCLVAGPVHCESIQNRHSEKAMRKVLSVLGEAEEACRDIVEAILAAKNKKVTVDVAEVKRVVGELRCLETLLQKAVAGKEESSGGKVSRNTQEKYRQWEVVEDDKEVLALVHASRLADRVADGEDEPEEEEGEEELASVLSECQAANGSCSNLCLEPGM